jgi:hypothetical protein
LSKNVSNPTSNPVKHCFFDKQLGEIGKLPRLMDVGQCNDAYSAIQIALVVGWVANPSDKLTILMYRLALLRSFAKVGS